MADTADDFDLASFIQSPMAMIGAAVGAAEQAKRTFTTLVDAVQSLQRSAAAMESILQRVDTMVGAVEGPAKVLGPEMERLAQRMVSMSDLFDRTPVDQLPELFEALSAQMISMMNGMAELPKRLGPLGELFGGAAGMMGLGRFTGSSTSKSALPAAKSSAKTPVAEKSPAEKSPAKKAVAKKAVAKKAVATKRTTKRTTKRG
jgi:hypothetical protein